ncbi:MULTISPECIES: SCO3242 family prenyltransferase [Catenuloplanes]|uniref:4-hydroxybenzoate polyprenyltransferase n=1 Tax=Catenuloplanes niger TaxID=587534 RepID=A0AAE3ZYK3_9ACTN|nr:UbiA family prenyltransferase [Catenuloplanes niger]MDR7328267.1 4-hydroxybenzoate polyprenyltransferase [Catenuloplanes niger]
MAGLADLAELVRAPAALSVPGDLVAGAGAAGVLGPATGALSAASVCLYWAGMAANDWADRDLDAVERPERPIPSGRVRPATAFGVAAGLTATGLWLAAAAGGRRSLAVALPLAATVWGYDLRAKNTAAGPAVMAACRALDVLLGATVTPRGVPAGRALWRALPTAAAIAAHTWTVTELSRREVSGATPALPATTLTATAALGAAVATSTPRATRRTTGSTPGAVRPGPRAAGPVPRVAVPRVAGAGSGGAGPVRRAVVGALVGQYLAGYGAAQARAIASPAPGTIRAAVGAGITGLPALQGALTARAGCTLAGLAVAAAAPLARLLARKVSPT